MKVDRELVLHVARLARLELSEAEVAHYETQLGRIVDFTSVLANVELSGGPGSAGDQAAETAAAGVERPDVERPSLPIEAALAAAPATHESAFVVPKIIE